MGTTPNNGWRYPSGAVGVAPDIPGDIKNLALDLDAAIKLIDWTPTVAGFTVLEVHNNYVLQAGHLIIGTAFIKLGGPISAAMLLNLPVTSSRMAGEQLTVGEVDFIFPGEDKQWRGRLLGINTDASHAAFAVDVASGRNNQISPAAIDLSTNAPFTTASTGNFYVNVRLQYAV